MSDLSSIYFGDGFPYTKPEGQARLTALLTNVSALPHVKPGPAVLTWSWWHSFLTACTALPGCIDATTGAVAATTFYTYFDVWWSAEGQGKFSSNLVLDRDANGTLQGIVQSYADVFNVDATRPDDALELIRQQRELVRASALPAYTYGSTFGYFEQYFHAEGARDWAEA